MSLKSKVETIEEYLARGGSVQKLPMVESIKIPDVVRKPSTGGPATIMSLEEADLFYGEARKGSKPKKAKPSLKIDLSALPEALRAKFINKLKEDNDGEEYEEESVEEEFDEDTDSDEE